MSPHGGRRSDEEIAVPTSKSPIPCAWRSPARPSWMCVGRRASPKRRFTSGRKSMAAWRGRGTGAPADARGECAPEARGGGPDARQAHPPGGAPKKRLRPARRRALAQWIHDRFQVSSRAPVCSATSVPTRGITNRRARDASALRMREPGAGAPAVGYVRIWIMLRREGWPDNKKRVHRLYRLEGLQVRLRARRKKRLTCPAAPCRQRAVAISPGAWTSCMINSPQVGRFAC